jgi:putative membrane protein
MIHTDRPFVEAVERAVRDAERGTAAELIVVVAARSGMYLDVAGAAGAAVALLVLLAALFAPFEVHPAAVAIEVPLAGLIAAWLAHRVPSLLRLLAPEARIRGQVERAAASHFIGEAVHGTRGRTGLLIYLSLLEQRAALVPDLGLDRHIPRGLWTDVTWGADGGGTGPRTLEGVIQGIGEIGALLRHRLPADRHDVNESPDTPRIVP